MHTEAEAHTKWCPEARVIPDPDIGHRLTVSATNAVASRDNSTMDRAHCIASDCMHWRWAQKPNPAYDPNRIYVMPMGSPNEPMYIQDREHGYCGLSGRP